MNLNDICKSLRIGTNKLALQTAAQKNEALRAVVESIKNQKGQILSANAIDVQKARDGGMSESLVDRLSLDDKKINGIIESINQVIAQTDPIGEEIGGWKTPNGLTIRQVRVPVGVVAIIYESRPNVTADAFCLSYKSGNSIFLRGSSSALNSNKAIVKAIKDGLESVEGGVPEAIELAPCESHDEVKQILTAVGKIDMALPRGGAKLIKMVVETAKVPVIETGSGVCHLYIDESADMEMAVRIAKNAKMQRPGVCNAIECIVVNKKAAKEFLPRLADAFDGKVKIHADRPSMKVFQKYLIEKYGPVEKTETQVPEIIPEVVEKEEDDVLSLSGLEDVLGLSTSEKKSSKESKSSELAPEVDWLVPAVKQDYGFEFLDYECAVKTVDSLDEAVEYINSHNTKHSESIITNDRTRAREFQNRIDASCVYVNASTRFTDGGEFGFGAELGISTQKLHARGPMGIKALTTTKYLIDGDGQIR
ncbi:MAG: glutamate-5-semialdehyde dehydrogenase [Treponema sp.]|nr:glutamate-5-semialdehyde dehydrogenase [Treponema sp.]